MFDQYSEKVNIVTQWRFHEVLESKYISMSIYDVTLNEFNDN